MKVRPISNELQDKAKTDLAEDPNRIEEDVKHIKEWLKKQPHIKARTDDQWLLNFLRGCKFSLERTKEKIDMFYTMRTAIPEFFSNRDPFSPEIQEILSMGIMLPLKKTSDATSPRVILLRGACYDPKKVDVINITKANLMMMDILVNEDDNFVICGEIVFQDMKNLSLSHMTAMTPSLIKKSMICFQEAYPVRPKGILFINIPSFFETIYSLFRQFLNSKMESRVRVFLESDMEELHKVVPLSILPKEYGGEGESIEMLTKDWKKKVESYNDWFKEDAKYKTDESKRPGKPKTSDELFGIEGSFRKLNVD